MRWVKIIFWILIIFVLFAAALSFIVKAATNINPSPTSSSAWDDLSGWWDFYHTQTVNVRSTFLQGYASSSIGDVSLDCATTRNGNICGTSNYGVCNGPGPHNADGSCPNGDASGNLTGWGWNDQIGWISFNCDESTQGGSNICAQSNYKVSINANGDFSGWAWNDLDGWISFNCANNSSCGTANYKVNTSWVATSTIAYLTSSIFDTQQTSGAILNSIIWQGTQPGGTSVDFQIAVSNSSGGPWSFFGPNGSATAFYGAACPIAGVSNPGAGPNAPICVDKSLVVNYRYLRYKIRLISNTLQTLSPTVNNVILNWSK